MYIYKRSTHEHVSHDVLYVPYIYRTCTQVPYMMYSVSHDVLYVPYIYRTCTYMYTGHVHKYCMYHIKDMYIYRTCTQVLYVPYTYGTCTHDVLHDVIHDVFTCNLHSNKIFINNIVIYVVMYKYV